MDNKAYIKEIFDSIQGEGVYIGYKQLFIRFSGCNLKCTYCDTDFSTNLKAYTPQKLADKVTKYKNIHSISLTGGEPLVNIQFLKEFLPLVNNKIYLETNGTLYNNLSEIIEYTDILSMDIKLNSVSQNGDLFDIHKKFIEVAKNNNKEIFVKVVFDEKITDEEINKTVDIVKQFNIPLILQPKSDGEKLNLPTEIINKIFNLFNEKYSNVRLIPQVHKFLNVR